MRPFDVHIPGTAKVIRIDVPVRLDRKLGIEIMTPEAHEMIEKIKATHFGLNWRQTTTNDNERNQMKAGDRAGAILGSADDGALEVLGYGTYDGDHVPPAGSQGMAGALANAGISNPRITLDNGKVVWGCECWWGPEETIKQRIDAHPSPVRIVDIDDARNAAA